MTWTNPKTAVVAGAAILVIGIGAVVIITRSTGDKTQFLADGSQLALNRVEIADKERICPRKCIGKAGGQIYSGKRCAIAQFEAIRAIEITNVGRGGNQLSTLIDW